MIIWLNGSFGVGKTTVAEILKSKLRDAVIIDPELIGSMLMEIMPEKKEDFQDYELWRSFCVDILMQVSQNRERILVPMTITNIDYYKDILDKLRKNGLDVREFDLIATKSKIIERLDKRKDSTAWAYEQVDRCIHAFDQQSFGFRIDTSNQSAEEVAAQILVMIDPDNR